MPLYDYPDPGMDDLDADPRCSVCKQTDCECCPGCGADPLQPCEPWCGFDVPEGFTPEDCAEKTG